MRLKRLMLPFVLALAPIATITPAFADNNQKVHVFVGNQEVSFQNDPIIENGNTFVEFRPIFEALGLKVTWDDVDQQVIGEKRGLQIVLTIGSTAALVNGHEKALNAAPQIINGRTLIPIRFVGESSGEKVTWNGGTETVNINGNLADDSYKLPISVNGNQIDEGVFLPITFNNTLYVSWGILNTILGESATQYNQQTDSFDISYNGKQLTIASDRNSVDNTKVVYHNSITHFPIQQVIENLGGTFVQDDTGVHITLPQQ